MAVKLFVVCALFFHIHSQAYAGVLDIILGVQASGTAAFDAGTCDTTTPAASHISGTTYIAGEDVCAEDAVIRTNDIVTYSWDFSSNAGATNNVTITQTLPPGMQWTSLPPQCLPPASNGTSPTSSISLDGLTIVCNVGTVPSGTTKKITPEAKVLGTVGNASLLSSDALIEGDVAASATSNSVELVVSSAPHWQIEKIQSTPRLEYYSDGTTLGYLITYYLGVFADNAGKGTEVLDSPFTLNDVVSYNDPVTNNSELYTWGPAGASGACTLVDANPHASTNRFSNRPSGDLSLNGDSSRAVSDSGSISCSQAGGPGTTIAITIAGTDSTLAHIPTSSSGGGTLPANRSYIVSDIVKVWVPLTDVAAGNAHGGPGIGVTNTYTDFDPDSISAASNFGTGTEPTTDNSVTTPLTVPGAIGGSLAKTFLVSGTKGTGRVIPGEQFEGRVTVFQSGTDDLTNIILCDKFDTSTLVLSDTASPAAYLAQATVSPGVPGYFGGAYIIEYSDNANWADATGMRDATCENSDGPWVTDPDTLGGGRQSATKVRLRVIDPLSAVVPRLDLTIRFKAADNALNTVVPNFGSGIVTELNGGAWRHETVPASEILTEGLPVGSLSDRVIVNRLLARIDKRIVRFDNSTTKSLTVVAGQTVRFRLQPTVTSTYTPNPSTTVTIVDTLPADLTYAANATLTPVSNVLNGNGTRTITWIISGIAANAVVPPIEFDAVLPFSAPHQSSISNCVDISSPDDLTLSDTNTTCGGGNRVQSSEASVIVSNPTGFFIEKYVDTPLIQVEDTMQFRLGYRNVSSSTISSADIIDVLPFNGDGSDPGPDGILNTADDFTRVPPTSFNGTLTFQSIAGTAGETFQYTKRTPGMIHKDPAHASNGMSGSTVWCSSFSGGTCPASSAEVTGVRITVGSLPVLTPMRHLTILLGTDSNREGDVYTNSFSARAASLALPVFSNDVTVNVMEGDLGNLVFRDENGNGVYEPGLGDTGIPGVSLELYQDVNRNGIVDAGDSLEGTTVTDSGGLYEFLALRVNDSSGSIQYLVVVSDSTNVLDEYQHTVGIAGLDSNSQNELGYAIILTPSSRSNTTGDFGYVPLSKLGDYIWFDNNSNGIQDAGEPPVSGVTVRLLDQNGNRIATTTTDSGGKYLFTKLRAGSYAVEFVAPTRFMFTVRGGNSATDSDANVTTGITQYVSLTSGSVYLDLDAGLIPACRAEPSGMRIQLAIDSGADQLRNHVLSALQYRYRNGGSQCHALSRNQYRKDLGSTSRLFSQLWTSAWAELPQAVYACDSQEIPPSCSIVNYVRVKQTLKMNGSQLNKIGTKNLSQCKNTKQTRRLSARLKKIYMSMNNAINGAVNEALICS